MEIDGSAGLNCARTLIASPGLALMLVLSRSSSSSFQNMTVCLPGERRSVAMGAGPIGDPSKVTLVPGMSDVMLNTTASAAPTEPRSVLARAAATAGGSLDGDGATGSSVATEAGGGSAVTTGGAGSVGTGRVATGFSA